MRLRQVCLVAEKFEATVEVLAELLATEVCFRDPGIVFFGLENALLPLGSDFLEVVAPVREDAAASRHLARRGAGGYMLLFQCADGLAAREHALAQGAQTVWQTDEKGICATHFHPRSLPGAIVSVDSMEDGDDFLRPDSRWDWAGPDWKSCRRDNGIVALAGAVIESPEPRILSERWSAVLDRPPASEDPQRIPMDGSEMYFRQASDGDPIFSEFLLTHSEPQGVFERAMSLGLEVSEAGVDVAGIRIGFRKP